MKNHHAIHAVARLLLCLFLIWPLASMAAPGCADETVSVHCGAAPSALFDSTGRLWLVFEQRQRIYVTVSEDQGQHFNTPVAVNREPEPVWTNGENRPKLALGSNGEIYVSWTKKTPGNFTGDIRFSRSLDGGRSFEPARTINDDGLLTSHRFETLLVADNGAVYLVWLDKRDEQAARQAGEDYPGAALYYTLSTDGGASFAANRKLADNSCECCRIAVAAAPDGGVAVFWRRIFPGQIRDHGFSIVDGGQEPAGIQRATHDNWQIQACPHHGPAMATAGDDAYHTTWFSGGGDNRGIFYGLYSPGHEQMNNIFLVTASAAAEHAYILRHQRRVFLLWKTFDGERTLIQLVVSADAGNHWGKPITLAATTGGSDHPFLLRHGNRVYLGWLSEEEGYRLLPVSGGRDK